MIIWRQAFDRGDAAVVDKHRRQQARAHHSTVDQHAARSADADAAAFLGAGQAQVVAQQVDEPPIAWNLYFAFGPVQVEGENLLVRHRYLPMLPSLAWR